MANDDGLEDGEWRLPEEPSKDTTASRSIDGRGDADEYRRRGPHHSSHHSGRPPYDDRSRSRGYHPQPRGMYRSRKPYDAGRGPSHRSMPPPYEGRPPLRGDRGNSPIDGAPRYSASARYSSYGDKPRFSMGHRGGKYGRPGIREVLPGQRPRNSSFNRESNDRSPFSMEEYQKKMRLLSKKDPDFASPRSPKAGGLHMRRDGSSLQSPKVHQHVEEGSKKEDSLASLNPADILEKIKKLDEKKEETKKSIASLDDDIENLKEALPILANEVGMTSERAPVPPSPVTLEVSEEHLSSDSEEVSDDSGGSTKKKRGKSSSRQSSGPARNLQLCMESLAPEQRKLISKFGHVLKEKKEGNLNRIILQGNEEVSRSVGRKFHRLYPKEMQQDANAQTTTRQSLKDIFDREASPVSPGVHNALRKELVVVLKQHVLAAIRYRFAFEAWLEQEKKRLASQVIGSPPRGLSTHGSFSGKNYAFDHSNEPTSPSLGRSSSRGGRNRGIVRSDLEERVAIATLQAVESVKSSTTLPTQLVFTERAARWVKHYQDWNRLVKNPRKEWEESHLSRVWSKEEKNVFADKFLLHHKDFARISTYLPRRTIPEIVKHYYATQRTKEFEVTRRKWQLRKRREKAEETALQRMGGTGHIGIAPQHLLEPPQRMDSVKTTDSTHDSSVSGKQKGRKGAKKNKNKAKQSTYECVDTYFEEHPKPNSFGPRLKRPSTRSFDLLSHLDLSSKKDELQNSLNDSRSDYRMSSSKLNQLTEAIGKDTDSGKKKASKSSDAKSVGRGRLPNANTDKKYMEAVQIYGKDFVSIASYMNRTVDAVKKYWERHSQRLKLDRLLDETAKPSEQGEKSDVSQVEEDGIGLEYDVWSPVLSILGLLEDTAEPSSDDLSDTVATMRPHLASIPADEWLKLDSMLLPGGKVGSLLANHAQSRKLLSSIADIRDGQGASEDIIELVRGVESYFEIFQHSAGRKKANGRPIWTDEDKESLIKGYEQHGKDWKKLQEAVPSKTMTQIKNFYQNYKAKYFAGEDTKRKSAGDADDARNSKKLKCSTDMSLLSLPKEVLSTLPKGVLDKMDEVMTNPKAQMEFNALMMMQDPSLHNKDKDDDM